MISNTTVISCFASIGQLSLLRDLYTRVAISVDVYEEVQAGLSDGYRFYEGIESTLWPKSQSGWLVLTSMSDEELGAFTRMPARLHAGEASCLAIAKHRGWVSLSDDRAARDEARKHQALVSGSIGCLVTAVERRLASIDTANSWLADMVSQGFRSPVSDLTRLVSHRPGDPP